MTFVVAAVDGEPLFAGGRQALERHAAELVASAAARAGGRPVVIAAAVPGDGRVVVPEVVGCDEPAFLRGLVAGDAEVVHAADLLSGPAGLWLSITGAVAEPGARYVPADATVEQAIEAAGGVTCGPSWVALASTLHARPPLDRDARLAGLRAIVVAPGGSTLARRARGDRRALDIASPLGIDRAWLSTFDAGGLPAVPRLSLALCTLRLGFQPGSLAWPPLDLDARTS